MKQFTLVRNRFDVKTADVDLWSNVRWRCTWLCTWTKKKRRNKSDEEHVNLINIAASCAVTDGLLLANMPSTSSYILVTNHLSVSTVEASRTGSIKCFCGKMFEWKCSFERHWQTHKTTKPFSCLNCGKMLFSFADCLIHGCNASNGRNENRSNSNGPGDVSAVVDKHILDARETYKPYVCYVCDKSFTEADQLKNHISRRHKLKYFDQMWML